MASTNKLDGSREQSSLPHNPSGLLARKLRWSRTVLLFERLWPRLWLPVGVTAVFVILSLAGLWPILPQWAHIGLLAIFAIALIISFVPLIRLPWPTRDEALRRIENQSGLPHRPASSYFDTLTSSENASTGKFTSRLWQVHRERMARLFKRMSAGWPRSQMQKYDPFALRALVVLLLPVAFLLAGDSWRDRLLSAFRLPEIQSTSHLRLDAWVTPPIYTGRPPVLLTDGGKPASNKNGELHLSDVPEKSVLIIRVNGADDGDMNVAYRKLNEDKEQKVARPDESDKKVQEYKLTVDAPMSVTVRDGRRNVFSWNFNVIKDQAPKISLAEEPKKTARGALRLSYKVEDDYGVVEARANFTRPKAETSAQSPKETASKDEDDDSRPLGEPPVFALSLPRSNTKKAEGQTIKDLTSHPWAGLEVEMTLSAKDQGGNETKTEPLRFRLPEREFTKPMARAVIEQRQLLVADPKNNRLKAAMALNGLTVAPEKFFDDKFVYLAMRSAHWRLKYKESRESVASVVDQLWDVAVRIEDGDLSDAERDLKTAQKNLEKALSENASDEEIKQALDELRQAISKYLQAMMKEAQKKNLTPPNMENQLSQNNAISPQDLDQMLKNIENLSKSGSKDLAQQMLNQLNNMLQNLQAGQSQQDQQNSENMMDSLNKMGELIQEQQKLLDDTYARQRSGDEQRRQQAQRERQGDRQGQNGQRQPGQQGGQPMQRGQNGQQRGMGQAQRGQQGQQMPGQGQQRGQGQGQQLGQGQGQMPQQGNQGQPGGQGENGLAGRLSQRQGDIRALLEEMMGKLKESGAQAPGELGEARQAMEDAQRSLEQNNLQSATEQQTLALDRLRKGANQMAQQMMQAMQGNGGRRGDRDPLGRRPQQSQGPDLGTSVKVPDEIDVQRARQILDELRKRLSEPTRPAVELDYIERLLRRF